MHRNHTVYAAVITAGFLALLSACATTKPNVGTESSGPVIESPLPGAQSSKPDAAEAAAFVDSAAVVLNDLGIRAGRAGWVQATYITDDTELLAAQANEVYVSAATAFAEGAARYAGVSGLSYDVARKLNLLRNGLTMPAPQDPLKTAELTRIAARMEGMYGKGKYCSPDGTCRNLEELSETMATSRDPGQLLDAWTGWHTISRPMRGDYARFVELTNEGARQLGFADTGALWRSGYDMAPDSFEVMIDSLWQQVRPLYDALHCYVRAKLVETYGAETVPPNGPIPAHLLGNMWAQEWGNIYDLTAPPSSDPGYDLAQLLADKETTPLQMVHYGENFFTSLGFAPLPQSFWERSLFVKPADRDVVCHASAWDIDALNDLRIKMCIDINAEDFQTIHHELGHLYYDRAYSTQPYLYRGSANDGFHEALGDAVALSVTPEYLQQIGLLQRVPPPSEDIGLLLYRALDKVAFLPFGLLVDKWRWEVFSNETTPDEYNQAWWELREKYQGVQAPLPRSEQDFDPGAKYHIPGNTPYTRYFLAALLQYQFHQALCDAAGYEGPLHRCSIYESKEAGERLNAMMALGQSRPWPEALQQLTGSPHLDATAILDYYAPLKEWLDEQNEGRECGW